MPGIFFPLFLIAFFIPLLASAEALFSEIMYDLEGSDTGREWIEVRNTGSTNIDLSTWKLFEAETNHKLTHVSGSVMLSPNSYAIIADNPEKFVNDWPLYSGSLFDSSFSLKNTSEYVALRDVNLTDSDSVTYASEWGATGDGQSLQLINGNWQTGVPTPGAANQASAVPEPTQTSEIVNEPTPSQSNTSAAVPVTPQIVAQAGSDRTVLRGADVAFTAESFGIANEPLEADRYLWNFGDGATGEGKSLWHIYHYPGEYVAIVTVTAGKYSASDSVVVTVLEDGVTIVAADSEHIALKNNTAIEIDVSLWQLKSGDTTFQIPNHTKIRPQKNLNLAQAVTNITVPEQAALELLYPNGARAQLFIQHSSVIEPAALSSAPPPVKPAQLLAESPKEKEAAPIPLPTPAERTVAPTPVELSTSVSENVPTESTSPPVTLDVSQLATAGKTSENHDTLYKWLLALVSVVGVGAIGVLLQRQQNQNIVDQFKIEEIDIEGK